MIVEEDENDEVADDNETQRHSKSAHVPKQVQSISRIFDFRQNSLPDGVEVIVGPTNPDETTEFVVQRDEATALKLSPGSYLKIATDFSGLGGKMVNDYTLTMDVMFDALPSDSAALFQSSGLNFFFENCVFSKCL